jgi:hypothetical protein
VCFPMEKAVEVKWDYQGLQCVVVRADLAGERILKHRCGYVRVPPGHAWHGKNYDEIEARVHGGLTFAETEPCTHEDGTGYWIGFDCAHFGDAHVPPGDPESARYGHGLLADGHYWTLAEVKAETERLADQVLETRGTEV